MKLNLKFIATTLLLFVSILFTSCEDPELNQMMDEYCQCVSASRYDTEKATECIELMDSIEAKYAQDPEKIKKVLDQADGCY